MLQIWLKVYNEKYYFKININQQSWSLLCCDPDLIKYNESIYTKITPKEVKKREMKKIKTADTIARKSLLRLFNSH